MPCHHGFERLKRGIELSFDIPRQSEQESEHFLTIIERNHYPLFGSPKVNTAGVLQPPAEPIRGLSVWRGGQLVEGSGDGALPRTQLLSLTAMS